MSSKLSEKPSASREELLHELEDIHSSLLSGTPVSRKSAVDSPPTETLPENSAPEDSAIYDEEIPLVNDPDDDLTPANNTEPVLPGQQSLFDEQNRRAAIEDATESDSTATPELKAENPFLPAHIREKLNQNRSDMLENLANVGATLAQQEDALHHQKDREQGAESSSDVSGLVDELVQKYLPMMEKELRIRLGQRLSEDEDS